MKLTTRLALAALLTACGAWGAQAQGAFPNQAVKIIVPFGPGSITDVTARMLADKLPSVWGQNVLVENRPGLPGTTQVAKAAPDGYTLMLTSSGHTIAKAVNANITFDPVKDFAGVTRVVNAPFAFIVPAEMPVKTLKEFIDKAKAEPGKMNFSSAGAASTTFLGAEQFRQTAGLQVTHLPLKSIPEAMTAVLRNDAQFLFSPISDAVEQSQGGKVKVLAVSSAKPVPQLPDVPTIGATLPGFEYESWFGIMAPASTPRPVVEKVAADIKKVLDDAELKARFLKLGSITAPNTPAEFDALIKSDTERFTKVLEAAAVKAN